MRIRLLVFVTLLILPLLPFFIRLAPSSAPTAPTLPTEPNFTELSIERIFSTNHTLPQEAKAEDIRTLIVTGDVIPARGTNLQTIINKDFTWPWRETAELLKLADLRVINLEAPLMKSCQPVSTGFTFCGDIRHLDGMRFAGINLVSLENNHIGNYGMAGINETVTLLEEAGIGWARRDHLAIKEVRGVKFGLLAYNGIGTRISRDQMLVEIRKARPQVDILMVSYHWGKEYERLPKTDGNIAPDDPREVAHLAVDAGVDLVLGNHPHWFQAVEIYKDRLIPYAHGNFIFDQMWSEETRTGVVGKYTFYKSKLVDVQYFPVKIYEYAQPRLLKGVEAEAELAKMRAASVELVNLDTAP